ncbi:hypothetical protein PMPD1_4378 (plasmid) [Paramixta manurensis]|uniref:Uncharacterized protein n=2 Tax=Paramixta manurensis TaxID=2740817 RepID=A0A6M8UEI5_9GAMM|nr:hypothetical protein PMPD1_4378 [Erwiniaceae bacterium PD-1]
MIKIQIDLSECSDEEMLSFNNSPLYKMLFSGRPFIEFKNDGNIHLEVRTIPPEIDGKTGKHIFKN